MSQAAEITQSAHRPVLLDEALDALQIEPEGSYLDGTFGRGGHSRALLARLGTKGSLHVVDKDPEAIVIADQLASTDHRVTVSHGSFAAVVLEAGSLDGVLLDLGVSSPQIDVASRGFSFQAEGPLDMRMDPGSGESAAQWLARVGESELADVLWRYGDERKSRRIARALMRRREEDSLPTTTTGLAQLIASVIGRAEPGKNPATRTFQALRIHLNNELGDLQQGLPAMERALKPSGRLVVISFHSLEDRLVKQYIRTRSKAPQVRRGLPPDPNGFRPTLRPLGRAVRASDAEQAVNPRARSAVMRVAEKCA